MAKSSYSQRWTLGASFRLKCCRVEVFWMHTICFPSAASLSMPAAAKPPPTTPSLMIVSSKLLTSPPSWLENLWGKKAVLRPRKSGKCIHLITSQVAFSSRTPEIGTMTLSLASVCRTHCSSLRTASCTTCSRIAGTLSSTVSDRSWMNT